MNKLLVVDGNNILIRALFAPVNPAMTNPNGVSSEVLYRCMNSLFRHIRNFQPTHFICVFDHGRSEYRINLRPEYKANRDESAKPDHEERKKQFLDELDRWQAAMDDLFLTFISQRRVEADDIIASTVHGYPGQKLVVSSDHDLLQLVSQSCRVHSPAQNRNMESVTYTEGKVREKYGAAPDELVKLWALSGDKGDNIIGFPRVGPKTALKKMREHNFDFEAAVQDLGKTEEDKERVRGNVDLISLHPELYTDLPPFEGLAINYEMLKNDIQDWSRQWGFNSFINRINSLI